MSDATQTQTLEQTFNKTDFGHTIYEYRKVFIGAIIAILVGITGFVLWKQSKNGKALEESFKVSEFQNKTWDSAKTGKLAIPELMKVFADLPVEVLNSPVMVPVALDMSKFLMEKNMLTEAETVLNKINPAHPISAFFVGMQKSVILEKSGKLADAVSTLEKLAQNKEVLMAAKVNLELGRLNLLNGEKGKAQTHFEYVINTFPNDEYAKLAKLYMGKLAQ